MFLPVAIGLGTFFLCISTTYEKGVLTNRFHRQQNFIVGIIVGRHILGFLLSGKLNTNKKNIFMATLKLRIVPTKILIDGRHKIRIVVSHNSETRYIPTDCIIDNEDHFKEGQVINRPYKKFPK